MPVSPKNVEASPQPLLVLALTLQILLAAASLLYSFMAPLPAASELPNTPLRLPGYQVLPLPGQPARAGRDMAYGAWRRFRLLPEGGGAAISLSLVPVHSRGHRRFQLADLTRGGDAPAGLSLQDPRLIPGDLSLAAGWLPSRSPALEGVWPGEAGSAGSLLPTLQTCLVSSQPGSRRFGVEGGVSKAELLSLLIPHSQGGGGLSGALTNMRQLLGLEPNVRWQCVVVSLTSAKRGSSTSAKAALLEVWHHVRRPLDAWACGHDSQPAKVGVWRLF